MPFPTSELPPRLKKGSDTNIWADNLVDFLSKNVKHFILPTSIFNLLSGPTNNLNVGDGILIQIKGPAGPFSITGIGGASAGRLLILINETIQIMTIANESISSSAQNRIITHTGIGIDCSVAILVYDNVPQRWQLLAVR